MKGMDAVKESIVQADSRVVKLIVAGRIDEGGAVIKLRRLLAEAGLLADEMRARELTRKEVITGEREAEGATSEDSDRCS